MAHPPLQGADIDAVLQVAGGVGMAELVQEPAAAVRAGVAAVDALGAVLQLLRGGAVTAVQLAAPRHALELFQHGAVGAAGRARENWIVGRCFRGTEFLKDGNQLLRNGHFPLLPVLRLESPLRFRGDAHGGMAEVDVAPSDEPPLRIPEAGHEIKPEACSLRGHAGGEQSFQFGILVNRADGFDEAGPVGRGEKLGASVLLQQLAENDKLVVDGLSILPGLEAERGEVLQNGAVDLVDVDVRAEFAEGAQDRAVGAEGPQGTVILDVILVLRQGTLHRHAIRVLVRGRGIEHAAAHGGQLGLFLARALGRDERVGPDRLVAADAGVPPMQEIHALGMQLIPALDGDVVAADTALGIEQGCGEDPVVVVLDFLEEFDPANSRHD